MNPHLALLSLVLCLFATAPARAAGGHMELSGTISSIAMLDGALVVTFSGELFHASGDGTTANHFGLAARVSDLQITLKNPAGAMFLDGAPAKVTALNSEENLKSVLKAIEGKPLWLALYDPTIRWAGKGIAGAEGSSLMMQRQAANPK